MAGQRPDSDHWDRGVETLERSALDALQTERLRRQLSRLYEGSAFYRARFDRAGVSPGEIRGPGDLGLLSPVTKQELRDEQDASPPFGRFTVAPRASWREVHPSTGTTGQAVKTLWSEGDVEAIADMTARTMWQAGVRPGDVVQNGFAYGLWVAGLSCHYGAGRIGCLVVPTGASVPTEKQIEFLFGARSTVLISTPSYALHIAEGLRERATDHGELALRIGLFGGEPGAESPATRAKIEGGLGLAAFDYYGLAEIGPTFASECAAKQGLHFAEDHVLVESVDPDTGTPVAEGELGVLLFTHLTREATPMLRYWSNDYARLSRAPCACGRTHVRAVGGILGRHDDLLIYRGAKFYPSQVEQVVRSFEELSDEFRIEVEREGTGKLVRTCVVVAETEAADQSLSLRLERALRDELGVTPRVRLEPVGSLERTTFKAKRIVDR